MANGKDSRIKTSPEIEETGELDIISAQKTLSEIGKTAEKIKRILSIENLTETEKAEIEKKMRNMSGFREKLRAIYGSSISDDEKIKKLQEQLEGMPDILEIIAMQVENVEAIAMKKIEQHFTEDAEKIESAKQIMGKGYEKNREVILEKLGDCKNMLKEVQNSRLQETAIAKVDGGFFKRFGNAIIDSFKPWEVKEDENKNICLENHGKTRLRFFTSKFKDGELDETIELVKKRYGFIYKLKNNMKDEFGYNEETANAKDAREEAGIAKRNKEAALKEKIQELEEELKKNERDVSDIRKLFIKYENIMREEHHKVKEYIKDGRPKVYEKAEEYDPLEYTGSDGQTSDEDLEPIEETKEKGYNTGTFGKEYDPLEDPGRNDRFRQLGDEDLAPQVKTNDKPKAKRGMRLR